MMRENKWLIIILAVLVAMIIGLIISILVVSNMVVDCTKAGIESEQLVCLGEVYSKEEDVNKINGSYNKVMEKALSEGNTRFFVEVLGAEASLFSENGRCEEAMKILDDERVSRLSGNDLAAYYNYGASVAGICGDMEKRAELQEKHQKMYESNDAVLEFIDKSEVEPGESEPDIYDPAADERNEASQNGEVDGE